MCLLIVANATAKHFVHYNNYILENILHTSENIKIIKYTYRLVSITMDGGNKILAHSK